MEESGVGFGSREFFKRDSALAGARIFPLLLHDQLHVGRGPYFDGFGDGCVVAGAAGGYDGRGFDRSDGDTLKCIVAEIFGGDDGLETTVVGDFGGSRFCCGGFFRRDLYDRGELADVGAGGPGGDGVGFGIADEDENRFAFSGFGHPSFDADAAGGVAGYEVMSIVGYVGAVGQLSLVSGDLGG